VLHEILEKLEFAADVAAIDALVAETLRGHGFDAALWTERVTEAIVGVLATPARTRRGALCLRDVAKERRLSEMEFLFPGRGS